jgi:CRISPR-associated protein Cas1
VKKLPPHFRKYEGRSKPATGRNRNACDPLNALLNFVYGCTTSRIETLLISYGADCTCGFYHADRDNGRKSLVYDLVEPVRPVMDNLLLSFLGKHKLMVGDFNVETRSGVVKLSPEFARLVATSVETPVDDLKNVVAMWMAALKQGKG